jgi:hypothetical protein
MSLKEEIDKRIEAERERLEVAAQKEREYYERQRQRFAPLAALLAEIKASVEPKYLNATVSEGLAIVRVGRLSGGQSEVALKWEIAPNGPDTSVDLGQCVSPGQHGFRIEETRYYNAISEFSRVSMSSSSPTLRPWQSTLSPRSPRKWRSMRSGRLWRGALPEVEVSLSCRPDCGILQELDV